MLKLAVIDDGVNVNRYNLGRLQYNIEIKNSLEISERRGSDSFSFSHGSLCSAIIKALAPKSQLSSIKILSDGARKASSSQLIKAIEWCILNKINIINMSLGTVIYIDFPAITKIINRAAKSGIIIVAAGSNTIGYTCPASLANVIGVKCDINSAIPLKQCEYTYDLYPPDGIEITAHSLDKIVNYKGETKNINILKCNSFAAPFIAAQVYNIMDKEPNLNLVQIKRELIRKSVNHASDFNNYFFSKNADWFESAIMFNINGKLRNIYSINYKIVKTIYIRCTNTKTAIKDIINYNISEFNKIDTIILYSENCSIKIIEDDTLELLIYFNNLKKNIIFIDCQGNELNLNKLKEQLNIKIWHTSLFKNITFNALNNKNCPLIVIYDPSGCYMHTLALKLKQLFKKDGYYCTTGTNKSSGILYEFEYIPINDIYIIKNNIYNEDIYIYCTSTLQYNINLEEDIQIVIGDVENTNSKTASITIKDPKKLNNENFFNKIYTNIIALFNGC